MSTFYQKSKQRARVRHRVKELLVALPVDTSEAKRVLREKTGMDYQKLKRLWDDPYYHLSAHELVSLANFFCVPANEIISEVDNINEIVKKIMAECPSIKALSPQ